MAKDEIVRGQRRQVDRQIKKHLDKGSIVKMFDKGSLSSNYFGGTVPDVPGSHVNELYWKGYWFIYAQEEGYVPSTTSSYRFISVSVDDPTNSSSSYLSQLSPEGKFTFEVSPDSDDYNEYRFMNVGVFCRVTPAVTGSIPLIVEASETDRVAVYQDDELVESGFGEGGIVTAILQLRKNTKTTISIQYYSSRFVGSDDVQVRSVKIISPIANYISAYEDVKPTEPQNPSASAREEGNLLTWEVAPESAAFVAGTEVWYKRYEEGLPIEDYRIVGVTDEIGTSFLHNRDIYEYFDNGVFTFYPAELDILTSPLIWDYAWNPTGGYLKVEYLDNVDGGWSNFGEAHNDPLFLWRFGSEGYFTQADYDTRGVYLYPVKNKDSANGYDSFRTETGYDNFELPVIASDVPYSMEDIMSGVPNCPGVADGDMFWGVFRDAGNISPAYSNNTYFSIGVDSIPINGDFDHNFACHSLLAFTALDYNGSGEGLFYSVTEEDDYWAKGQPQVYFRVKAFVNGTTEVEALNFSAISNGKLAISGTGEVGSKEWAYNVLQVTAADMTANIINQLTEGDTFVVSSIEFNIRLIDPALDYRSSTKQYYKLWLLGGAHLFPTQGTNLEEGREYGYQLRHYTEGYNFSSYAGDGLLFATAVMPIVITPPSVDVNIIDVDVDRSFSNVSTPLRIEMTSLSRLASLPVLELKHKNQQNIYNVSYRNSNIWHPIDPVNASDYDADFQRVVWNVDSTALKGAYDHSLYSYPNEGEGLWPNPADYGFPFIPNGLHDHYFHKGSEGDELEVRITAYPADSETTLEYKTSCFYDPDPLNFQLVIDDVYTRSAPVVEAYSMPSGSSMGASLRGEMQTCLAKLRLQPYNDAQERPHRVEGKYVKFIVMRNPTGISNEDTFAWDRPIQVREYDIYPSTEPFAWSVVSGTATLYDYYLSQYGLAYTNSLVLDHAVSSVLGPFEYDRDKQYELQFDLPPEIALDEIWVYAQVENQFGELFETSTLLSTNAEPPEAYSNQPGYSSSTLIDSFTGYTLDPKTIKLYNPKPNPQSGGVVNKWSTYESFKIKGVDTVSPVWTNPWPGDTILLSGNNLVTGNTVAPYAMARWSLYDGGPWLVSGNYYGYEHVGSDKQGMRIIELPDEDDGLLVTGWFSNSSVSGAQMFSKKPPGSTGMTYVGGWHSSYGGNIEDAIVFGNYIYVVGYFFSASMGTSVGLPTDIGVFSLSNYSYLGRIPVKTMNHGSGQLPFPRGLHIRNNELYVCGGGGYGDNPGWVGKLSIGNGDPEDEGYGVVNVIKSFTEPVNVMASYDGSPNGLIILGTGFYDNNHGQLYLQSGDDYFEYNPGKSFNGPVLSLKSAGSGQIYAGGGFSTYGGSSAAGIILLLGFSTGSYYTLGSGLTSSIYEQVRTIKKSPIDNKFYFCGTFPGRVKKASFYSSSFSAINPDPVINIAGSSVNDIWFYEYFVSGSGELLPPDFRKVYEELYGSAPTWSDNLGPFMCKFIGSIPSPYSNSSTYPLLHDAFFKSHGAASAGLIDDGYNGLIYRLSENSGDYLESLGDTQYGSPSEEQSLSAIADQGYLYAKAASTYIVRHFNPGGVMDANTFLNTYVTSSSSPASIVNGHWWNYNYPATSYVKNAGESSVFPIFSSGGAVITPRMSPISNVYAFTLNRPPGASSSSWGSDNPVTLLCFPMSDTTGAHYQDDKDLLNFYSDPLYSEKVAAIGGIRLKNKITPTTDYLNISALKDTKGKNISGFAGANQREQSFHTNTPGFVPTYTLKYMTDSNEIFENASVVYSSYYGENFKLDVSMDTTSGSYSFGPTVSTSTIELENAGVIITDLGESYLKSESGAKSYTYSSFTSVEDPETGYVGVKDKFWGGAGYDTGAGYSLFDCKTTLLQGSNPSYVFTYGLINQATGAVQIKLVSYIKSDGRIQTYGNAILLAPPGSLRIVHYDVLPGKSSNEFYVVTVRSPSPYGSSTDTLASGTDNFTFYLHRYTISGSTISHSWSRSINFRESLSEVDFDDLAVRESYGVYGFRDPSLAWVANDVLAMSFAVDYGNLADKYISESRIAVTTFEISTGNTGSFSIPDYAENYPFKVISQPSQPEEWSTSYTYKYCGYGRYYNPRVWTNCIISNGNVTTNASLIHTAYIVNETPLYSDYRNQPHKWNSDRSYQIDGYGRVLYGVVKFRKLSSNQNNDFQWVTVGAPVRPFGIYANLLALDQDKWGNVVVGYTEKPDQEQITDYNNDKFYPRFQVLNIDKISVNSIEDDMSAPLNTGHHI